MKSTFAALVASLSLIGFAQATVSLNFNNTTQKLTNLANAAGVAGVGMNWGIVVSTSDATFAGNGLIYDGFDFNSLPLLNVGAVPTGRGMYLSVGGVLTDDFFYTTGLTTTNPGGTDGGAGSPTGTLSVLSGDAPTPDAGANGITNGDFFSLLWLSAPADASVGANYGFLNSGLQIPAGGSSVNFGSTYAGADPLRSASNVFQGVPEPSRLMLLGCSLVGLSFRRRR